MQHHVPYGYKMDKGKIHISVIDAYRVKLIFHEYLYGKSQKQISIDFTKAGLKTPNKKDIWNHATIRSILTNKKYTGDEYHIQIIDEETFKEAQRKRKTINNSVSEKMKFKNMRSNCFSKRVFCGECDDILIRKKERPNGNSKTIWRCKNYIKDNKVTCSRCFIEERQLENLFVKALDEIIKHPNLLLINSKIDTKKTNFEINRLTVLINKAIKDGNIEDVNILLLERATEIYDISTINDQNFKTRKLIDAINEADDVEQFSEDLFEKIVKKVIVYPKGSTKFIFINDVRLDI